MSRPHGYTRYQLDGCRCYTCSWAKSSYDDRRRRLIAYGRWEPFGDLAAVQKHLRDLTDLGYGYKTIARLAGLGTTAVCDLRRGRRFIDGKGLRPVVKVRRETAAAILAVPLTPDRLPDGATVDSAPTLDLIRSLVRAGYDRRWIAREAGLKTELYRFGDRILVRSARAIQELYLRVGDTPGPSVRARNEGIAKGWPLPFERWAADRYDTREEA